MGRHRNLVWISEENLDQSAFAQTSASTSALMSATVMDGSTSKSHTLSGAMIVSLIVVVIDEKCGSKRRGC